VIEDKGLVTFFELDGCGFYPTSKSKRTNTPLGFDLKETLDGIIGWVEGRSFQDTLPVDISPESDKQAILFKSYCKNKETGDYLFVFWQCMNENDGKVGAVVSDSTVGDSSDDTVNIASDEHNGKKLTPGHPMYFWFIPEFNVFASIKFGHSTVSTDDVASYIRAAVRQRILSKFRKVIMEKDEHGVDKVKQVFFRDEGGNSLNYVFNQRMIDIQIDNINLEEEAKKVTHLVIKEYISKNKTTQRDYALKIWGMTRKKLKQTLVKQEVETITEIRTSGQELRDLIELYYGQRAENNGEIDIGYRTSYANKTTTWFSKYLSRPHLILDKSKRISRASYRSADILHELNIQRNSLLMNVKCEFTNRVSNEN
tara:strand:- start:2975 stop:4081 length:1107 start_codon:yes stop_codon:yes gene_type:complete